MLRGSSFINLDAKGRLAVPTRYRSDLQEECACQLVVTVALGDKSLAEHGCLWMYPLPAWEAVESSLSKSNIANKAAVVQLKRFLIGNASECEMDAQGRLLLPEKLRKLANIEKKIVLVGQLNKFEIWNEDVWIEKENELMKGDPVGSMEELSDISF